MNSYDRPIVLLIALFLLSSTPVLAQGRGPAKVSLAPVVKEAVAPTMIFPGTALPIKKSRVSSARDGLIVDRLVFFGQKVSKGEVIVRLDATTARARRDAARALVEQEKSRLDLLEAGARREEIQVRKAEVARARATHEDARRNWDRAQELFQKKAVSENDRDGARARYDEAAAALDEARAQLALVKAGARSEEISVQRAALARARAQLAEAEHQLAQMDVRVPFDGEVAEVFVEIGDWVSKGGEVLELVDLSYLDVGVLVPQVHIDDVPPLGAAVPLHFPRPEGKETVVEGKLVSIGPQAMLKGRTIPIVIRFRNDEYGLHSGTSCQVHLPVGPPRERVLVPKDAIVRKSGGATLAFLVEDGKAAMRPVQLGGEFGDRYEVLSGLNPGESVVIRGNERLRPGVPVLVQGAAGNATPREVKTQGGPTSRGEGGPEAEAAGGGRS